MQIFHFVPNPVVVAVVSDPDSQYECAAECTQTISLRNGSVWWFCGNEGFARRVFCCDRCALNSMSPAWMNHA